MTQRIKMIQKWYTTEKYAFHLKKNFSGFLRHDERLAKYKEQWSYFVYWDTCTISEFIFETTEYLNLQHINIVTNSMCKIAKTSTILETQPYNFILRIVARFQATFFILQVRLNIMTLFLFILGRGEYACSRVALRQWPSSDWQSR